MPPDSAPPAVILAAGRGTRMRHLTEDRPKPMLPVHGRPVLEHILIGLRTAGVREAVIIVGYLREVVSAWFGDGSRIGMRVRYVEQTVQDGTGRAPLLAQALVGSQPFFLTYGDILVPSPVYAGMLADLRAGKGKGILAVKEAEDVTQGAAVILNADGRVHDVIEKPPPGTVDSPWYNAGVYLFPPALFAEAAKLAKSPRGEYELTDAITALIRSGTRFHGHVIEGYWTDVRDPESLRAAHAFVPPLDDTNPA